MKVVLGSLALLLVVVDGRTRLPRSLSKAALEATKRTPKLRKLEQKRVRGLTEMIKKEGKLTLAKSPRSSERVRPERKSRALKVTEQKQIAEGTTTTAEVQEERKLENNYNYNYNNGNANNNAEAADGEEAAADGDNVWQYNWNYEGDYDLDSNMDNEAFGFDMTSMSFHYTGCSAIKTWNDDMAQDADTDTVLMAQRMATFRLCPTASCSSNTYNGCSSNYGDYVVSMDQFLLGMLTMQEDRVMSYCEYCQECADIESFKSFYSELEYRREYLVQSSTKSYESWVENYKANYANANANNANGNYYNYNANGEEQEQAADDDKSDDYYQQLYYKKLTSGNYANNYVYGGNGAYQNYQQNGNGYQYNNNQQNYENYANNYNNNNGQNNNGNSYYYNNNGNQAYGGNYGENQGQYGYQSQYSGGDDQALTDDQVRANTYQEQNSAKWQMWDSFNQNLYGQQNGGDYQMYQQMSQQMQAWSGMGAWNGHRVVNGRMTYDNGVATWEAGWGYIGSDGEFYSLEDTKEAIQGTDWGYELPNNWEQWLDKGDEIESCSYDNAGSCYNQFFACMQVLGDDTYSEYVEQFNEQLYEEMFEDAARERFMASMTDYLECTKIDFDVDWNGGNDNNQNQDNQNQDNQDYQGGYSNGQWQAYEGMDYQGQWEQYRADDGDLEFYIGPHCDGDKITLGVYTDEYCSTYASGIAIEDLLGFNPMDDADEDFTMVPTECVSCAYNEVSYICSFALFRVPRKELKTHSDLTHSDLTTSVNGEVVRG